ncbi:transglutaminase-like domain-containing protein [Flammeovirga kamogawensis]|uniref:Transglutaminase-like domain-containing protein n=1 Tax=Flammeovirga kamogawensis TaxID=373891 RepID=A0ABX8H1S1_9BACT|nr:transglutaminase-like domain-containing protein [Flammeovirga kamogawensis]MBB6462607.1 hypothetical protein [Flammeovirga kamogawensis]QWG09648.1 transglutaminase-like domain-containing protein [Flammeovirga kamogawensis]TRX65162.1 transglutaminase domain-containing protein [Flammeovirga kamogawensis]
MKLFLLLNYISLILFSLPIFGNDRLPEVIYLKKKTHLNIELVNGLLNITEAHDDEKLFVSNIKSHSREDIYFSDFDEIKSIEAYSFIPTSKKLKGIKVKNFDTSDVVQKGIFYSGYKNTSFVYPQLIANSGGKLLYTKNIKDAHFISPFYFQDNYPIKDAEYSVTFPSNVKINYFTYGENKDDIVMSTLTEKDKTTYTWVLKNIDGFKYEEDSPSKTYTAPHIIVLVDSYEYLGNKINVSSSVSDLYKWYASLINKVNPCDVEQLEDELSKIISPTMEREEAKKAVFNWVQNNIKYIAFEDGMAGFIPRSACDVLNKRYGDCKDMAHLLYSFYQVMGVDAHLTWIGTRKKPYSYKDLPSTIADNHMICAVSDNDTTLFLDATNPFSKYGTPSSMIQGKEALIGNGPIKYEIIKVPELSANNNSRTDSIWCSINDTNLEGHFTSSFKGYFKEDYLINDYKSDIRKDKQGLRDFLSIGKNNIKIDSIRKEGFSDKELQGIVHLKFEVPSYSRKISNKYYVNLNIHKPKGNEKLDEETRTAPFEKEYKYTLSSTTVLTIPKGYTVHFVPENKLKECTYGAVETVYDLKDNKVIYTKTFVSDFLLLQPASFSKWNQFMDEVSEINQENVILKQTQLQ